MLRNIWNLAKGAVSFAFGVGGVLVFFGVLWEIGRFAARLVGLPT